MKAMESVGLKTVNERRPNFLIINLAATFFLVAGCGTPLRLQNTELLKPGMTREEVISIFGAPLNKQKPRPRWDESKVDVEILHYKVTSPNYGRNDLYVKLTNQVVEYTKNLKGSIPLATELPRIQSIGLQSFITFDGPNAPAPHSDVIIPIEGKNLDEASSQYIAVKVTGTVPISTNDYSWSLEKPGGSSDWITVRISNEYFTKVKSGDQLDVMVDLRRVGDLRQPVCFGSRRFTLYDTEYYRQNILATRIPTHDIQAFPLPEEEAKYLFGGLVARNYFVVRLAVRNTRKEDRLISTGMIVASGRAIVRGRGESTSFTIPVNISPQSTVHMYSILDDREQWGARSWTFRSLEFVGALAAATATTYGGPGGVVPADFVTGTVLYSGIFVPSMAKFWPNQWPGYKRNLVAYGMPEILKVPTGTVSNPRYLFFSKEKIQAVVADQTLFESFYSNFGLGAKTKAPEVRVISLAFDNMEIPFENVFTPTEVDVRERIFQAQSRIAERIDRLKQLQAETTNFSIFETNLTSDNLDSIIKTTHTAQNSLSMLTNQEPVFYLRPALSNLIVIATAFKDRRWKSDLFDGLAAPAYSLKYLEIQRDNLSQIQKKLLNYSDTESLTPRLKDIEQTIVESGAAVNFYSEAASCLSKPALLTSLTNLSKADELAKPNFPSTDSELVISTMIRLREERGILHILPNFYPEVYTASPKNGKELIRSTNNSPDVR